MAAEQFATLAQSTLAGNGGSISAGATTLKVASAGGFPLQPQFRIRVEDVDPTTGLPRQIPQNVELMLVTALGASWAVTRGIEGTTAVQHGDGSVVTQVVTAGALTGAFEQTVNKGAASGYMGLDASSRGAQSPKLHAADHQFGGADPLAPLTLQPTSDATALGLTANAAQTTPLLTINATGRSSPFQQWQGINRGNGTRYMTQVGGMGSAQPFMVTNCFVLVNGQANEPFQAADLTVAGEGTYMLAVRSDVSGSPAVVLQGGNNAAPLIRGYSFGGTKVVDIMETGQLLLPATSGASAGLVLGGDANLYRTTRSAVAVLATDYAAYAKSFNSDTQASGTSLIALRRSGDNNARLNVNTDGSMSWGGGSGAADNTLQRSGSDFNMHLSGGGLTLDTSGKALTLADGVNIVAGSTTGAKIGTATTQKLGFFNAAPVVQPSGTPAAATDLASVITLANSLRTNLLALGLVA